MTSSAEAYRQIPELAALHSGDSLIRVPDQRNVPFTTRVRRLVDTEEFQRLSEISQLGLVSLVYPGARHTRFEHALGVFHNSLCYVDQLVSDPRFREHVSIHGAEVLIASALLHDLGHWPFCHPIEDMGLPALVRHESFAERFLGPGSELAEVLVQDWNIQPAEVLDILAPQTDHPELKLLRSILSGPIDVDKMDYLDRDSLHCGVPYGRNFDRQRLIQSLMLNETGDGLAINAKGKTAAELMVFARYVMFSEVYWHHAVRSATSMFARAFYELHDELDLETLFDNTDAEMIATLREIAHGTECEKLLEGLFGPKRVLYKRCEEFSHDLSPENYNLVASRPYREVVEISRQLAACLTADGFNVEESEVLIDAPPPHREVEFAIDVYFPKQNQYRPLQQVSPVIHTLATSQFDNWVKRVRIFVHPRWAKQLSGYNWANALKTAVR